MDIKKDFKTVFVSGVEEPLDLIGSAIHAANVRAVRYSCPITDGEANDFNFAVSESLNVIFSDPSIPMGTHQLVSLNGAKCLAKGVGVHADALAFGFAEEAVKKGGGDPRFEDHPATDVGTNHGISLDECGEDCEGKIIYHNYYTFRMTITLLST